MNHRYILENADSPTDTRIIDTQADYTCYRGSDRTASALVDILNRLHTLEQGVPRLDALNARIIALEAPTAPPTAPAITVRPEASALVAALHGLPNVAKIYLAVLSAGELHRLARAAHSLEIAATEIARNKEGN
jgi:hypothetical protein